MYLSAPSLSNVCFSNCQSLLLLCTCTYIILTRPTPLARMRRYVIPYIGPVPIKEEEVIRLDCWLTWGVDRRVSCGDVSSGDQLTNWPWLDRRLTWGIVPTALVTRPPPPPPPAHLRCRVSGWRCVWWASRCSDSRPPVPAFLVSSPEAHGARS